MEGQQTCSRCKKQLSTSEFSLKKGDKYYKTCYNCRNKSIENKRMEESIEESIEESNEEHEPTKEKDKKPKRENRPSISDEKKQIILREQDYKCRGPRVNDYYICAMNVSNMKFSDVKSVIPQYDHITRWREGGNGIMNIQILLRLILMILFTLKYNIVYLFLFLFLALLFFEPTFLRPLCFFGYPILTYSPLLFF